MLGFFSGKKKEGVVLELEEETIASPYPYLDSEYNEGILIGEYNGQEVRLNPFGKYSNNNIAIVGHSGAGKTTLIQNMLQREEGDMIRFVISTRGYEFENLKNTSIVKNMVINPFDIHADTKKKSQYITAFLKRFGNLKHIPVQPLKPFEENVLMEFTEGYLEKYAHTEQYSFSSLQTELAAACNLLEEKADFHMRLFSHNYKESNETPYEFYNKHQEQFIYMNELKKIGVYKKIQEYIDRMREEDLLKYFEGRSNLFPLHYGITVINLMELELEIYKYSKNTTFVMSVLLEYLEVLLTNRQGKKAIYIDPLLEFMTHSDYFKEILLHNLSRGRTREISYRLVGFRLPNEILANCNKLIHMGPCLSLSEGHFQENYPESRYIDAWEGLLVIGPEYHTMFRSLPPIANEQLR